MAVRLHGAQRTAAIKQLAGWAEVEDRDAIRKTFHFGSFREAWAFMTEVALIAEKMGHHPEWFNVYNRVEIILATHDLDGVSDLDIQLARAIDELAPQRDRGRGVH
ncbi:MAG TPA: 4a-hydroxytetrahydrobiopterin dehydratase [Stellaceae bacterium]|nr:4a-hydroxytetrahydrobiopterin dehydratase [Stellaceae bacterium]